MSRLTVIDHTTGGWPPQNAHGMLSEASGAGHVLEGLYVHVPFCSHRCHYCDFFTIAGRDDARPAFVDRLLEEASVVFEALPPGIRTVFIGGGTPTYLEPVDLSRLLNGLRTRLEAGGHSVQEWTVEANPDTVSEEVASALAQGGVTRVSLGAQSFAAPALAALDRRHDPDNVRQAMNRLRQVGLEDLSLDLIFAIPEQRFPLNQWKEDLEHALAMEPTHLSAYGLMYESGTPLRGRLDRGQIERVDEDIEAAMYEWAIDRMADAGFEHYEISNWAQPGRRCRHNEIYWTNQNWWPLGPSASGHLNGCRWRNRPRLGPYLEGHGLAEIDGVERLDADRRAGEMLMLGLRRLDGVPEMQVKEACAQPGRGQARAQAITQACESGLLAWRDGALVLTRPGLLLADSVMGSLL